MGLSFVGSVEGRLTSKMLNLTFRKCRVGEYYENFGCHPCPTGTYSLSNNIDTIVSSCNICPESAVTCMLDFIQLDPGYWRISNKTSAIFECPIPAGCIGGYTAGSELCAEGYEGFC